MESVEFNTTRRKAALFELLDQPSLVNFFFFFVFVIVFDIDLLIRLETEKEQIVLDGERTLYYLELSIDILLADYLYFFGVVVSENMNTFKLKIFI